MAEQYVYFYLPEDYESDDENTKIDDTEQRPQRTASSPNDRSLKGRIHTLGDIAPSPSTHTPATDTTNSEETRALEQEHQFAEWLSRINEQLRQINERFDEKLKKNGFAEKVAAVVDEELKKK
ncbi:hypothetical protein LTR56_010834 [Elasticomyces elasticus]|nr:hypothetical protein LTR56_010834 [Elasticomyces elasticus]KAK3650292.1 hypothetical protein LTR22_012619 [Elasticomyces elasticus]KAK4932303.1 hypothetical protein LTR49_001172 [Elasticomyces elasticus]KAK5768311.1 hypothetical protein LTS12_001450 [Elasticomyces elasticus]